VLGVAASGAATEVQHQVKRGLLLDVVVRQGAAIVQLLPCEDETLLVRRDTYDRGKASPNNSTITSSLHI
jgi:hypothetical protein